MLSTPRLAPFVAIVLAGGCGAAPGAPVTTPKPTPAVSGPRVVLPSGAVYSVEIARTPEEQAQGLMYRESLPPAHGMVFPFPEGGVHNFWMKNTMIPLDIVWIDDAGKVVYVSANTPPCKSDPCPNYGPNAPASVVLEIGGGKAAAEGIVTGATIRMVDVAPR